MLSNREKAIVMVQSSLLIAEKPMLVKDVFLSTKITLEKLDIEITDSEYIKIFNDILEFNEVDVGNLAFQIRNR